MLGLELDLETVNLPEMAAVWQETLHWQPTSHQQQQLQQLYNLILDGNRQLNLTRITEPTEFWEKHLWDSLRGLAPFLEDEGGGMKDEEEPNSSLLLPPSSFHVIDIGTGGGFPGIPAAIARPDWQVTLLDSTQKKVTFLQTLATTLGLENITTLVDRAEQVGQLPEHRKAYDLALIRAVGSASVCAEYALPLLKLEGQAVLYRGQWTVEETEALRPAVAQLGGAIAAIEECSTPISHSMRHCLYLRKVAQTPSEFPRAIGVPAKQPL
uniref:16S rRNA (guanine(527)-N(7))-methyltransferase RsmG n=1 Tax=Trichocoleus desertorum TaxID=1481672 RepID=UPI0025B4D9F4|nr:16S rRNA (guanine(527)-N(7))-methyltransferase RsmG [Trichocoleus desertorum]